MALDSPEAGDRRRIPEIDAVRGLALCGILVPNIIGMTEMPTRASPDDQSAYLLYESVFHQRFFPIFSFLFGLSFALFLRSAERRSDEPRAVLMARLAFLIPFGALHQIVQPGEVLLQYAIVGLVILLPATFLPRSAVLVLGVLATTAAVTLTTGGSFLIPGLFLLGLATAQYEIPDRLGTRIGWLLVAFGVSWTAALALNLWQVDAQLVPYVSHVPAIAGVVTGVAYITGLLILLHTPARRPLAAVLGPLGRMALTNYVTASVLIVLADYVLNLNEATRYGTVLTLAATILAAQTIFSQWWLLHHHYGPTEWAWRSLTWWELVPNKAPPHSLSGTSDTTQSR